MQQKYFEQKQTANSDYGKKFDESVEHVISACSMLAKEEHVKRHDILCA
jgi:hypothetical protein